MNLYYEDVDVGARFTTPTHEITAPDIAAFCKLTRDFHPLHTDEDYAKAQGFPGIIAHGLFGLSLMEGLKTELRLYEETSIASLGWDKVRFVGPIVAGAVVHVEMEFTAKRESLSRPAGIITEAVRLMDEAGTLLIDSEHISLIRKAP
ncbi:MaoC family dehydratase [Salipiger mucosus]|uniref:Putative monoamine oxidase regulatory protein n=1 Tax=Salipiger mucosus DSM 16094 TaxID=1123237 RepID=S9R1A2_9RHOB|nr:MaoC/PaaZ C-terminal domain-containing protein [Salipiger mucosus]EPX85662.1 putative monoamine oxidase regulatory protein [Salipiger mucosus DSM 16094]